MITETDFYELQRLCPLTCPFLQKKKDAYVFLCAIYQSFLEIDRKGGVRRHRRCGEDVTYGEFVDFKTILDKLNANSSGVISYEQNSLLENIFQVLDKSEQNLLMTILGSPDLADSFLKQFEKQPKDNDLLVNTRSVLREYEEKDSMQNSVFRQKQKLYSDKKNTLNVEQQIQMEHFVKLQKKRQNGR